MSPRRTTRPQSAKPSDASSSVNPRDLEIVGERLEAHRSELEVIAEALHKHDPAEAPSCLPVAGLLRFVDHIIEELTETMGTVDFLAKARRKEVA
jgi:hypothetical protein